MNRKQTLFVICSNIILILILIIMLFVLEHMEVVNEQKQEQKISEQQEVQNIEIVIPEQNNYGTIEIYDDKGKTIQTIAHGIIQIKNDGSNGEPIEIIMCAGGSLQEQK